jgi:hypothetical protein
MFDRYSKISTEIHKDALFLKRLSELPPGILRGKSAYKLVIKKSAYKFASVFFIDRFSAMKRNHIKIRQILLNLAENAVKILVAESFCLLRGHILLKKTNCDLILAGKKNISCGIRND